jgi:SAM-dependent methyltransferase
VNKEQVRQSYASVADLYIELFGTSQQVHPDDLAFIERHLVGQPGAVLDLGCGPGHITGYLRALGVDATGIDMVPEFIGLLTEFRRAMAPAGTLVLGLFDGDEAAAFDHKVVTAYRWPAGEMSERLARAGFTEIERLQRPADGQHRPHVAMAAIAADR